jgi:hypothetical protein
MHHDTDPMTLRSGANGLRRLTLTAHTEDEGRILARLAERLVGDPDPLAPAIAKLLPLEVEELPPR